MSGSELGSGFTIHRTDVDPALWFLLIDLVELDEHWRSYTVHGDDGDHGAVERPDDWPDSVVRFLGAGLDPDDLHDLIDVTMGADHVPVTERWRYFCGCAWTKIRGPRWVKR